MKKLFTMMSMAAMTAMTMAQSVTTYSVYDVNQSGEINVADAVSVAQAALHEVDPEQTQQYVTGEELSTMFSTILTKLESLESRLSALESKQCGCSNCGNSAEEEGNDPYTGHEFIDLGLPSGLKWATCNLGALRPEDYGLYYAWGDTIGYSIYDEHMFSWENYRWCNGSSNTLTKYNNDPELGEVDNLITLMDADDAASKKWGGNWHIPSPSDFNELYKECDSEWTTINGHSGYKFTGKNGRSIFLPAPGFMFNGFHHLPDYYGAYWANKNGQSINYPEKSIYSFVLNFTPDSIDPPMAVLFDRYRGLCIRPVAE